MCGSPSTYIHIPTKELFEGGYIAGWMGPPTLLHYDSTAAQSIKHAKELLSGQASSFTLLMGVEHMKMNKTDLALKNIPFNSG